jgi:hypothetical protein
VWQGATDSICPQHRVATCRCLRAAQSCMHEHMACMSASCWSSFARVASGFHKLPTTTTCQAAKLVRRFDCLFLQSPASRSRLLTHSAGCTLWGGSVLTKCCSGLSTFALQRLEGSRGVRKEDLRKQKEANAATIESMMKQYAHKTS